MAIVAKEGQRFEYLLDSDDMDVDFISSLFHSKTIECLNGGALDCNLLGSLSVPSKDSDIETEVAKRYQDGSILFFDRVNEAFHFVTAVGQSVNESLLDYSTSLFGQTIDSVVMSVGKENVLGRGTFSTVLNISFGEATLAMKLTSGKSFLQKEYQENKTRVQGFEHRMSLADHLRVRQVIEDINSPFIRQPKLYGFSLFLGADKEEIVEVVYMESIDAQCYKDLYYASSIEDLNDENKRILNEHFNGDLLIFSHNLLMSYVGLNWELHEQSGGRLNGRVGDIKLDDPARGNNLLVDGYDPKTKRFKLVLIDVTEYEKCKVEVAPSKNGLFKYLGSLFSRAKSYLSN